jgi:hypothetical protein
MNIPSGFPFVIFVFTTFCTWVITYTKLVLDRDDKLNIINKMVVTFSFIVLLLLLSVSFVMAVPPPVK